MAVMVTLPTYHICLICTAIESPPQGGLPPQGEQKAYVTTVPRSTCVSQNRLFAILMKANHKKDDMLCASLVRTRSDASAQRNDNILMTTDRATSFPAQ